MASPAKDTSDRLAVYRAKRDFARTPEPAGQPSPDAGQRFVVQRHRARRLHYDLRLEADGVLISWAVPKGPTLDPKARRLAVHVEDHPVEYYDFEGVIPEGEYGGGDVIVWDWGTWSAEDPDLDLAAAVRAGEVHVDLHGQKLAGRFVLVRRDDKAGEKEQWLLLHKNDDHAVPGWDPEEHPESVKSGRTNDEVAADPKHAWHSDADPSEAAVAMGAPEWDPPTDDELHALADLGREGTWTFQGRELRVTNLDKVLYPGRDGEPDVTKREVIAYHAAIAPWMLPYLAGRPVNLHRFPDGAGRPGFWHKEHPGHAPNWLARWRYEDADPDETQWYTVVDSPPALAWLANYGGAVEIHPWTSTTDAPHQPTWALIDLDPGDDTGRDDLLLLATLHRTALEHLQVEAAPKVTGKRGIQIWIPVAEGYTFDDTRAWVERLSRMIGQTVPELISWEWERARRKGRSRLDFTQNAINKTLVVPFGARPAPGAPVSVPIEWDELDDPELRPDRWTIRTVVERLADAGDPMRRLVGRQQRLPDL